jgi:hypothetical protein
MASTRNWPARGCRTAMASSGTENGNGLLGDGEWPWLARGIGQLGDAERQWLARECRTELASSGMENGNGLLGELASSGSENGNG